MRILWGCASVLLYLALFFGGIYAVEDWRGARAWQSAVREAREHGGTTDFAAVIPPPIPDGQNLAMAPLFVKALDYHIDPKTRQLTFGTRNNDPWLDGIAMGADIPGQRRPSVSGWQHGRPTDLSGWQACFRDDPAFPKAPGPQSPAEAVLTALSRYKAPLGELAIAAAARPQSRFPINWTSPEVYMVSVPQTDLLRKLATALSVRASAEVASGKQADAVADIALGFRLADAVNDDPMLIDELVSNLIITMMEQPIWDGLAAGSWNADQLERIQALLSRQNALAGFAAAVRTEEASVAPGVDYLEKHGDGGEILRIVTLQAPTSLPFKERLFYGFIGIAPKGWYDQNKARIVDFEQRCVLAAIDPARRRVFPSTIASGMAEIAATRPGPYTFYFLLACPIFEGPLKRAARTQVSCDQAAIACALERYSLDHHSYPNDLAALTPDYLATLPADVISGGPIRYERIESGRYRLSNAGWPAEHKIAANWVWDYPD